MEWRSLFFLTIIALFGFTTGFPQSILPYPHPQFACKPPYNSYQFCNITLSVAARAQSLISHLTLPEKIHLLIDNATGVPRLGIPPYKWWSESLHGINDNGPGVTFNGIIPSATSFPQVIVTGASFNRSLWYEIAAAIGVEARAFFNVGQAGLTFWAPNINIFRDPRWGRGQETTGEDPLVAAAYAVEFVRGFQGEDRLAGGGSGDGFGRRRELAENSGNGGLMLSACCKHYSAYDVDKWGIHNRYNFDAVVTEQDMEDTYQPPFKSCIQQGKASCVMCSYNSINGVPACAREDLLRRTREEWGFNGYITSDCEAVSAIYEHHNFTTTREDAVAITLKAGMDIECGNYTALYGLSAIQQGKLEEGDIDRALFNLFSVQIRLGIFNGDPANGLFRNFGPQDVCTSEHKALALEAARQGTVLLKNENKFLPLKRNGISSLALIGPMANNHTMGGDYTGIPCSPSTVFDAFQSYSKKISYAIGCLDGVPCKTRAGFAEALSVAREADTVILVAGLDTTQEYEEVDRYHIRLPGFQKDLIEAVAAVSKRPLVLVLTGAGSVDVSFAKNNPRIASIVWIGYPGEIGGKALAEIIFGDYNPGGRLPVTWYPSSFTNLLMTDMNMRPDLSRGYPGRTYRFYIGETIYEFGDGLSYTTFTYTLLSAPNKLSLLGTTTDVYVGDERNYAYVDELRYCDTLVFNVQISVTNNGGMDGSNVVLLFSRVPNFFKGAPRKQLIGFDRVHTTTCKAAETNFVVNPCEHLSFADEYGRRILLLGNHTLMVGDIEHIVSIEV
ncbi:probable beta-D-xylosidase 6 [Diospyros lotus]|uniref:probable beta-D-xylosidase 6 n=1 Tax=Diospyros lotus TaxID=55363 RepID=UPI0022550E7F|nr:probable beta-D-xylosidase 6 [Diospyros lotus]